jgi:hypothetical protein
VLWPKRPFGICLDLVLYSSTVSGSMMLPMFACGRGRAKISSVSERWLSDRLQLHADA